MQRFALLLDRDGKHVIEPYDARRLSAEELAERRQGVILGDFATREEAEQAQQKDTARTKMVSY